MGSREAAGLAREEPVIAATREECSAHPWASPPINHKKSRPRAASFVVGGGGGNRIRAEIPGKNVATIKGSAIDAPNYAPIDLRLGACRSMLSKLRRCS